MKECIHCGKPLEGRSDKKYCDVHCKSAYQYIKVKLEGHNFYQTVDKHLKLNRKLLKQFNKAGKATVRCQVLEDLGFNAKYFTHYWKNKKGDVYLFAYEYGFLKRKENSIDKFILIKWQDYMIKPK